MKLIQIQRVSVWADGAVRSADTLGVYNFNNYNFDGTDSSVSYKLGIIDEFSELTSFAEGSVAVPDAIVQAWGTDDDPIIDFVLATLNLEAV